MVDLVETEDKMVIIQELLEGGELYKAPNPSPDTSPILIYTRELDYSQHPRPNPNLNMNEYERQYITRNGALRRPRPARSCIR